MDMEASNSDTKFKRNVCCYLCDNSTRQSDTVDIFCNQNLTPSLRKLPELITYLTDRPLEAESAHSSALCKKCFQKLHDYDELYIRLEEMKKEIVSKFKHATPNDRPDVAIDKSGDDDPETILSPDIKREDQESSPTAPVPMKISLPGVAKPKVSPMPPNVVIIHKGKKIAIKRTDSKIPSVRKIEFSEQDSPVVITKLQPTEDNLKVTLNSSNSSEDSTQNIEEAEIGSNKLKTESLDDDEDNSEEVEEMEINDFNSTEEVMSLTGDIENGDILRMNSSGDRIVLEENNGNEVSMVSDDKDQSSVQDSEHEHTVIEAGDEDSNEGSHIELQISDDDTARQVFHLASDSGVQVIQLEPDSDLAKALGSLQRTKVARGHKPIVERNGDLYTCLLCPSESDENDNEDNEGKVEIGFVGIASAVAGHMRRAHSLRVHVCDVCGDVLRKLADYNSHLEMHLSEGSKDGKGRKCSICSKQFPSLAVLKLHCKTAHRISVRPTQDKDTVKNHKCAICGKKYSSKNLLDEHMNVHNGVRPYECLACLKSFASKYTYQAHLKTHTDRPRSFTCPRCPKAFYTIQNLHQHEKTHSGIKEFLCKICGKAFGTSHNLIVHGVVHSGHKPHVCKTCGKAFARRAEIRDHERTHTGERPYACDMCPSSFSQRSNLQSHKRATHLDDKRYGCQHCEKRFKRRRLLEYHVKASHTGERPYRCEVCSATFVYPEHFKKHRRIHSGEKPYVCEVCGKSFNSRDNRNAHRFIHSDKKPYECLSCGAGFMRKPLLYTHMNCHGHLSDTIVVNQPRVAMETRFKTSVTKITSAALLKKKSMDDTTDSQEPAVMTIKSNDDHEDIALETDLGTSAKMLIAGEHFIIHDGDADRIYATQVVGSDDMTSRQLIFTSSQGEELDKATLSLVQENIEDNGEMLSLVAKQESDDDPSPELVVQESDDTYSSGELETGQIEIMTDENRHFITSSGENGLLRLVQVRLPNGDKGWLALDS